MTRCASEPDDVNQEGREVPASLPRVDFFHWVLVDLPADLRDIEEGTFSSGITPRGKGGPLAPMDARQASTRTRPGSPTTTT